MGDNLELIGFRNNHGAIDEAYSEESSIDFINEGGV